MVQTYRLVKQAKMIKTDDFSSVFNFRKRISTQYLAIHYQPNMYQRARLGLVVGKKTAKLAVSRNYMRRVIREFFRLNQHQIGHVDLIIRVQKKFCRGDFIQIKQEFDFLISKLNQRVNANAMASTPINISTN
ncbi:MAG: ribonuclease P protein component [Methylotenera sp.]|nr:ribonuclease P protein component [Methylotenera sp.]